MPGGDDRCVAVVTGAGRGIGRAIAERLHRDGFLVVPTDRSAAMAMEVALAVELEERPGLRLDLDVSNLESVRSTLVSIQDEFGRLDVVVNNAMWMKYRPLGEVSEIDMDRMYAVGVKGPLWMAQAAAPLLPPGGNIVNIASVAASLATPNSAVYSAVKGALVSLTRQLALDLGERGIRVNAVSPGPSRRRVLWQLCPTLPVGIVCDARLCTDSDGPPMWLPLLRFSCRRTQSSSPARCSPSMAESEPRCDWRDQ